MNALAGTGALIRLILRRDRVVLPLWVVLLAAVPISIASSFAALYATAEARQVYANGIAGNPAELALIGPVFASTLGGLTAWRSTNGLVLVPLASLLTVIRHTRTEEEAGRRELLGATVVGRHAPLTAALIVTFGANLALAALAAGGLIGLGLPTGGSIALGLSLAAAGWIFAAVAGVVAQLTESPGTARGIAGTVLGACFVLRAIGDASGAGGALSWLSFISPIGWLQRVRSFAGERWWLFAPAAALVGVLCAMAFALSARRDLGAGVLAPRLGPATAAPGLRSPLALAWRLQRGALVAWTVGYAAIGAVFGFLAKTVADQLNASPQLRDLFAQMSGAGPGDGFFTFASMILGEVAAVYAIQATLRLRSEEVVGRVEPVLATAAGRLAWACSHLVFPAIGSAIVLGAFGLTAGLFYGLSVGDVGRELPRVLGAALTYLPAVWSLAGVAVALFGLLPRVVAFASWGALSVVLLLDLLGELQQVSQGVLDLSPFTHIPKALIGQVSAAPLVWLLAVTVALTAAGLVGFRRREVG
jgi:ABC-2 type transport system permease protein